MIFSILTRERLMVMTAHTQRVDGGWMYRYQTEEFVKTGSLHNKLIGGRPFRVSERTGLVSTLRKRGQWGTPE